MFKTKLDFRSLFDANFSTDTTKVLSLLARYLSFKCHKKNKADGADGLPAELVKAGGDGGKEHTPAYLQNMAGRKHAQQLEP